MHKVTDLDSFKEENLPICSICGYKCTSWEDEDWDFDSETHKFCLDEEHLAEIRYYRSIYEGAKSAGLHYDY